MNLSIGLALPNIKAFYKAIVIKTVQHQHRGKQVDEWNRMGRPETD